MSLRRIDGLDVLRAAAILAVVLAHGDTYVRRQGVLGGPTLPWTEPMAVAGVELFFVLSGFLIGSILLRELDDGPRSKGMSFLGEFWMRRWLRTLPNYYLFVVVHIVLATVALESSFSLANLFFAQSLVGPARVGFFTESWSLAVEEWFYLVLPIMLLLLHRSLRLNARNAAILAALLLIAVPMAWRSGIAMHGGLGNEWDAAVRRPAILRLDALGWGVLAGAMARWHPRAWSRAPRLCALGGLPFLVLGAWMAAGILRQVPTTWVPLWISSVFCLPLISVGTAMLLPFLSTLSLRSGPLRSAIQRISLYSYSWYLVHLPLAYLFMRTAEPRTYQSMVAPVVLFGAWIVLSFAAAALLYHGFERPILQFRDGLFSKASSKSATRQP